MEFFDLNEAGFVQFKLPENRLMSSSVTIRIDNDHYFVYDKGNAQLYRFCPNGNIINLIGREGSGPEEYKNVIDFCIDAENEVVDILCEAGTKMKTYKFDGEYVRSFNPPQGAVSFAKLKNNHYMYYGGFSGFADHYRLKLTNSTKVIDSQLYLRTSAFDVIESNFYHGGLSPLFREIFLPVVYKIDSMHVKEYVYFDFGRQSITLKDISEVKDPFVFFEKFQKIGYVSTIEAAEGTNYIGIRTLKNENMEMLVSDFFLYKPESSVLKVPYNNSELSVVSSLIHIDKDDFFYYSVHPVSLNGFIEKNPGVFSFQPEFNTNGNQIILILPLSKSI
jgi:hypothetical protein